MPDFSQPVSMSFVLISIGAIFALIAVGIAFVKLGKKSRNLES
jgi:subtilase family serine protease